MRVDWQLNILYWIHNSSSWTKTDVLNCKLPTIWDNFHCRIYDLLILNVVDYATKNGPNLQPTIYDFPLLLAKTKEQIWMNAFTGLHANTQKNHLNENLYRFIRLHTKRNTSEWKTLNALMPTQNKTNKIWITGLQVFMPKQKRNNFEQKPLQAYMPMLKVKKKWRKSEWKPLQAYLPRRKTNKTDARCLKQNVEDNKNVLTNVLVTISASFLQLSHLTFLLIWSLITFTYHLSITLVSCICLFSHWYNHEVLFTFLLS